MIEYYTLHIFKFCSNYRIPHLLANTPQTDCTHFGHPKCVKIVTHLIPICV